MTYYNRCRMSPVCSSPYSRQDILLNHPSSPLRSTKGLRRTCKYANVVISHCHENHENSSHPSSPTLKNDDRTLLHLSQIPISCSETVLVFSSRPGGHISFISYTSGFVFGPATWPCALFSRWWTRTTRLDSLGVYGEAFYLFQTRIKTKKSLPRVLILGRETCCKTMSSFLVAQTTNDFEFILVSVLDSGRFCKTT